MRSDPPRRASSSFSDWCRGTSRRNRREDCNPVRKQRLLLEPLEDRRLLAVDWRNPVDALDVNGDGIVVPPDALVIINDLDSHGPRALPTQHDPSAPFLDATGDQFVGPLDALRVINHLNTVGIGWNLTEGSQLASETNITITLGQDAGTRNYRVELDTTF